MRMRDKPTSLAIIGAGPVGLVLALLAARTLPAAAVALFDQRPLDADVSADARTLAISLGSVQLLQRLGAWRADTAQSIGEVHVSEQPSGLPLLQALSSGEPTVRVRASDEGVATLGAVQSYGRIVAPLQQQWLRAAADAPDRLQSRFSSKVGRLSSMVDGAEVAADATERFDLAIVAEGGVFSEQARKAVTHDYLQAAWVGSVALGPTARPGVAYERFTRHGPVALLPLKDRRAALVWCVSSDADDVASMNDLQRLAVLNSILPDEARGLTAISPLKRFPLGLNAERTLVDGRVVRIGNAAQTLHPVAGQGLNLGLRDAWTLVENLRRGPDVAAALRHLERQRAPDRWATIATTDFLARSFMWRLPGAVVARGLGLAALDTFGPLKSALARHMMFGVR